MPQSEKHFTVRSKIWIEDDQGNVVFGEGRYRILEIIDRVRSLQGAAKELKMSYRAVWGRLKASEQRLGKPLVEREGKGSRLTPFARELMTQYRSLLEGIHRESDGKFAELMADPLERTK